MSNNVRLQIQIDSKTGQAEVVALGDKFGQMGRQGKNSFSAVRSGAEGLKKALGGAASITTRLAAGFAVLARSAGGIAGRMVSLVKNVGLFATAVTAAGAALAAWKLKNIAEGAIQVGSAFDNMKLSLDTVTQGKGDEWFEKLNTWALKMPVNTAKAVESFIMMRAMGLKPTIEDMTTLVDTVSALGDPAALEGIARALGQIQTKGKVSMEEIMQIAERGVPVFDILREKMGLTAEQLGNIGNQGLDAGQTIKAIMEGMAERFGGQADKMSNKWSGLVETLKSYWVDFQRMVMDAGVMAYLEGKLKGIIDLVDQLRAEGKLQTWAEEISDRVIKLGEDLIRAGKGAWDFAVKSAGWIRDDLLPVIQQLRDRIEIWFFREIQPKLDGWIQKLKKMVGEFFADLVKAIQSGQVEAWIDRVVAGFQRWFQVIGDVVNAIGWVVDKLKTAWNWWSKVGEKLFDFFEKNKELMRSGENKKTLIEFLGKGSSIKPLGEKIDEMQSRFDKFAGNVSGTSLTITADASPLSAVMDAVSQMYAQQLQRVVNFQQNYAQNRNNTTQYGQWARQAAFAGLQGAQQGLEFLQDELVSLAGLTAPAGGSGGAMAGGGNSYNITVNVPAGTPAATGQDWRLITREHINPELERAGH